MTAAGVGGFVTLVASSRRFYCLRLRGGGRRIRRRHVLRGPGLRPRAAPQGRGSGERAQRGCTAARENWEDILVNSLLP
jgi:hypothetical protein